MHTIWPRGVKRSWFSPGSRVIQLPYIHIFSFPHVPLQPNLRLQSLSSLLNFTHLLLLLSLRPTPLALLTNGPTYGCPSGGFHTASSSRAGESQTRYLSCKFSSFIRIRPEASLISFSNISDIEIWWTDSTGNSSYILALDKTALEEKTLVAFNII